MALALLPPRPPPPPRPHRQPLHPPTAPTTTNTTAISRLSGSRQLILALGVAALVLILPLLYVLLSSSFLTSALCSSAFLASTTFTTKHSPPLTSPLTLLQPTTPTTPHNTPYHPHLFTLPHHPATPTYLTAHIDPSTSLHTQLTQFLYAPYLAFHLNLSYAYNPLSKAQGQWGRWLGLGWGERAEDGLLGEWGRVRVFQYDGVGGGGGGGGGLGGGVEGGEDGGRGGGGGVDGVAGMQAVQAWIADKRRKVDDINKRLIDYSRNKHKLGNLEPPHIEEPKGSHITGPDTTALNPTSPINTASVLRLSRLPLPALQLACYAPLHLLVRQKYCAARVREPVPVDLFAEDRARGRMIVAVHYRCGDECYHPTKAIPLSSTLTTLRRITVLATQHSLPPPFFHLFTSPPPNDTATNYFHPLTTAYPTTRLHLSLHSHLLLHHLVASDVVVLPGLAASGLSWLAELLHGGGVVLVGGGVVHGCGGEVGGYREREGEFDGESFVRMWRWSVEQQGAWRRFGTVQDCYALKPLVPPNSTTTTSVANKQTVTTTTTTAAAAGKS